MKKYGLIGKSLKYSYSKTIHDFLINYFNVDASYQLIELEQFDCSILEDYDGLNITIPYKQDIISCLDMLDSPIKACNTFKSEDNKYLGYNTDIIGFAYLVEKLGLIDIERVVVLGSGASSLMVREYFKEQEVIVISRQDERFNYEYLEVLEADLLINTTPVGMSEYKSPIREDLLTNYKGVIDINYNPINSKLALDCKRNDVKFINGLYMLIKQACASFEIWHDLVVNDEIIDEIMFKIFQVHYHKIALMGMPLSGKSTLIRDYNGSDLDSEIEKRTRRRIKDLIDKGIFRDEETRILKELVMEKYDLIALGGGAILKHENLEVLKDYLIIFYDVDLQVLLERFSMSKRPLLKTKEDIIKTYNDRIDIYNKYANVKMNKKEIENILSNK